MVLDAQGKADLSALASELERLFCVPCSDAFEHLLSKKGEELKRYRSKKIWRTPPLDQTAAELRRQQQEAERLAQKQAQVLEEQRAYAAHRAAEEERVAEAEAARKAAMAAARSKAGKKGASAADSGAASLSAEGAAVSVGNERVAADRSGARGASRGVSEHTSKVVPFGASGGGGDGSSDRRTLPRRGPPPPAVTRGLATLANFLPPELGGVVVPQPLSGGSSVPSVRVTSMPKLPSSVRAREAKMPAASEKATTQEQKDRGLRAEEHVFKTWLPNRLRSLNSGHNVSFGGIDARGEELGDYPQLRC